MVNAAINNEKIIGMALLKPGWESDYYGNPDVYDVIGMGRIVSSEVFEDGKINIILYGLKRAKIQETRVAVLEQLYQEQPSTRREIENAEGYAVLLRGHIDKEDKILYPLAERALPDHVRNRMLSAYDVAMESMPDLEEKYSAMVERYENLTSS